MARRETACIEEGEVVTRCSREGLDLSCRPNQISHHSEVLTSFIEIEICGLNHEDLEALAKKTYILITTVGPYAKYGEFAFRACAENGTHYLDVTGETPWTGTMIGKYESAAQETGAMMFPQIGIESAPPDLVTWSLAKQVREKLSAKTGAVTVSIHKLE